jgi:hypothetical protein
VSTDAQQSTGRWVCIGLGHEEPLGAVSSTFIRTICKAWEENLVYWPRHVTETSTWHYTVQRSFLGSDSNVV